MVGYDSASKQRWLDYHNQRESAAFIGLLHVVSSVLPPVESYQNYRKPTQRGVQGYLSSLQRRLVANITFTLNLPRSPYLTSVNLK